MSPRQRTVVSVVGDELAHRSVSGVGPRRARASPRLQIVGLRRREQFDGEE